MALLTPQTPTPQGSTPSYGAVSASDTIAFTQGMHAMLIVKNAGGSSDTVALATPGNVSGFAITDASVSVPATTGERWIMLDPVFVDPATGLITVTHTSTASVTCAVVSL